MNKQDKNKKFKDETKGDEMKMGKDFKNNKPGKGNPRRNHPDWYTRRFAHQGNSLIGANFGRRRGILEANQKFFSTYNTTHDQSMAIAAKINLTLTAGGDSSSSWRQGLNDIYNTLRRSNTGKTDYSILDIEKYVLTVRAAYAGVRSVERGYKLVKRFESDDATTPYSLFAACGVDYETFSDNAADIYNQLQIWYAALRRNLILNIPLIERTNWLFGNIFQDSNDDKCSYFAFAADDVTYWNGSWTVTDFSGDVGSTYTGMTWSLMESNVQAVIDAFMGNSTFATIAGDMLKAFGKDAAFSQGVTAVGEELKPIYDEYALTQIQNSICFGYGFTYTYNLATHVDGTLWPSISFVASSTDYTQDNGQAVAAMISALFVNSPKDKITDGELLAYTRLMPYPSANAGSDGSSLRFNYDLNHGTEVPRAMIAYKVSPELDDGSPNTAYQHLAGVSLGISIYGDGNLNYNEMVAFNRITTAWSQLDYAPRALIFMFMGSNRIVPAINAWDANTYAKVTSDDLNTYHAWANMSLLAVPATVKESSNLVVID